MKKLFTYVIMLYASRFRGATDPVSGAGVKPGELYEYHGREKSLGGWFRDDQPHLR